MTGIDNREGSTDLFGEQVKTVRNMDAYAAMPGTGPEGKQCRHCEHLFRQGNYPRLYSKCGLIRSTRGTGTDISMYSPACRRFEDGSQ